MASVAGAVVVGYDGSHGGALAVDWAALEAARRRLPLVVLHAANVLRPSVAITNAYHLTPEAIEKAALTVAEEGAQRARQRSDAITVQAGADIRGAPVALRAASEHAALVIVGNRGHGQLAGALLGSVAFAVAAHAHCPVVVVRGGSDELPGPSRPVVVGVDGSPSSIAALDHAADVAQDTGAPLHVIVAWQYPSIDPWFRANTVDDDVRDEAVRLLRSEVAAVAEAAADQARHRHPAVEVRASVRDGGPVDVLTNASAGAGLVVVGARGRGDLASLLLGSVSRGVIHRALCPVEIVR